MSDRIRQLWYTLFEKPLFPKITFTDYQPQFAGGQARPDVEYSYEIENLGEVTVLPATEAWALYHLDQYYGLAPDDLKTSARFLRTHFITPRLDSITADKIQRMEPRVLRKLTKAVGRATVAHYHDADPKGSEPIYIQ